MSTATDATETTSRPRAWDLRRRREPVLAVAVGVLVTVVAWLRLTPVARETVWAEDGTIFLAQASSHGLTSTLFAAYAGYLHSVPRLAAEVVATFVPTPGWAYGVTVASCVLTGAVAAGVVLLARDVVTSLPARVALGLAAAVAPLLPLEVLGNLANIHWLLLWLAPWLLLARGGGRVRQWVLGLLAFLVATTEVQAAVFAPLLLWRPRERGALPRLVLFAGGLALQAHAVLTTPRPTNGGVRPDSGELVLSWLHVVVLPWFLGTGRALVRASGTRGTLLALAMVALVVLAVVVTLRRGTRLQSVVVVAAPLTGALLWVVAVVLNTPPTRNPDGSFAALRYGYVPSLLVLTPVVIGLTLLPWVRVRRAAAALLTVVVVTVLVLNPAPLSARGWGPLWDDQARVAGEPCDAVSPPPAVDVPIGPFGWFARIPCQEMD